MSAGGIRIYGERAAYEPNPDTVVSRMGGVILADINREMTRLGQQVQAAANKIMTAGAGPGDAAPDRLSVRTGALRSSVQYARPTGTSVIVGSHLVYAGVHEYGEPREIRPVKSKWLTIPTREALTAAGVEKDEGKRQRGLGRARMPSDLVFRKWDDTHAALIHRRTGKTWYRLRKSVKTKPRPYLWPAAESQLPRFERRITELLLPMGLRAERGGA